MKKVLSLTIALLMLIGMFSINAFAADTTPAADATVYVTIANKGSLVAVQEAVTVKDNNSDGVLTIDEALYAAHEAKYEGGATAGYESYTHAEYGLSLKKLWGDTSGSFGYYVNNASAWSLADEVKEGDYVNAFVYADGTAWSDQYTFFDKNTATLAQNGEVSLTLSGAGYDAEYNPITVPVADATITLNGEATTYKTDAEGKVTVKIENAGKVVISATSEAATLVPPVCVATVSTTATANVYVTLSKTGTLVMTQEKINVTDTDKDGALTINDALYAAHEAKYEGGANAGYGSAFTQYGLSMTKLWGDTSGGFGYYVNNASAWSLADTIKEGDYVNAFVYADQTNWSDKYCFFDKNTASGTQDGTLTLTLSYAGYDASYNPVVLPVEGATITIDGVATTFKTDAEGKVSVTLDKAGDVVIGATSDSMTLVPPVCKVNVAEKAPDTTPDTTPDTNGGDTTDEPKNNGCGSVIAISAVSVVAVAAAAGFICFKKKKD